MLEHRYRFHGHGSVRRLYQHGRSTRSRALTVRYFKNPHRVHSRVTIVVAKKVFKSAVKRNRIRRRLYEIVRTHWQQLEQPYDIAIIVFDGQVLLTPSSELEAMVLQLLSDARLLASAPDNQPK